MKKLLYIFLFAFSLSVVLPSCREKKADDMEEIADDIEDAADDVGDAVDDVVDDN